MTFISHAQNYEDVLLWRALKHVDYGFYIDVGAWSPDLDSVTRSFYEAGWSGINIEPNPVFHQQLLLRRPRDINLGLAIGESEDTLSINIVGESGMSTFDEETAQKHLHAGWHLESVEVEVTTLQKIWALHVPTGREVHFLKVDVEGLEQAVLKGNDWARNRPWITVVEATRPMSQVECHDNWEPILLEAEYMFAYADGLNRYYIAREHPELLPSFKYPPNLFDDFKLVSQHLAEARAAEAETRAMHFEQELKRAYSSNSWKLTLPLRWASNLFFRKNDR